MAIRPRKQKMTNKPPKPLFATATAASPDHPNQDAYFTLVMPNGGLSAGVFDGVGCAGDSDKASHAVAAYVRSALTKSNLNVSKMAERVQQLLQEGDRLLKDQCKRGQLSAESGTTAVLAVVLPPEKRMAIMRDVLITWAGDSRCYALLPDGQLNCLTIDNEAGIVLQGWGMIKHRLSRTHQSALSEVTDSSQLSSEELRKAFCFRNVLDVALWSAADFPTPIYAMSVVKVPVGTKLLLCSDGIHDNLCDSEMRRILQASSKGGAQTLITAANRRYEQSHIRAKTDDLTAVLIEIFF